MHNTVIQEIFDVEYFCGWLNPQKFLMKYLERTRNYVYKQYGDASSERGQNGSTTILAGGGCSTGPKGLTFVLSTSSSNRSANQEAQAALETVREGKKRGAYHRYSLGDRRSSPSAASQMSQYTRNHRSMVKPANTKILCVILHFHNIHYIMCINFCGDIFRGSLMLQKCFSTIFPTKFPELRYYGKGITILLIVL